MTRDDDLALALLAIGAASCAVERVLLHVEIERAMTYPPPNPLNTITDVRAGTLTIEKGHVTPCPS